MSKASEWAKTRQPAGSGRPTFSDFAVVTDAGGLQLCGPLTPAYVLGHAYWTTVNAGGALEFARWLIETFGEEKP